MSVYMSTTYINTLIYLKIVIMNGIGQHFVFEFCMFGQFRF